MSSRKYKYSKSNKSYLDKDGNQYYLYQGDYVNAETYLADPRFRNATFEVVDGQIIMANASANVPEKEITVADVSQGGIPQTFGQENRKLLEIKKLEDFLGQVDDKIKKNPPKFHSLMAKYFLVHPSQIPEVLDQRVKRAGFVYNPISKKEQKATAKHMKQLLKIYDYDAKAGVLRKKAKIDHVLNLKTGNIVKKETAEKLAKKGQGFLHGKIFNTVSGQAGISERNLKVIDRSKSGFKRSALAGQAQFYQVELDLPIPISDFGTDQIRRMIDPYIAKFKSDNQGYTDFVLEMGLMMIGKRGPSEYYYQKSFDPVVSLNNDQVDEYIDRSINRVLNQYRGGSEEVPKVYGIYIKMIALDEVRGQQGGCDFRKIFGSSSVYLRLSSDLVLLARASTGNNCLFEYLHYFIRQHRPDKFAYPVKERFTPVKKKILYATDRVELGLDQDGLVGVEVIPKLSQKYHLGILFYRFDQLAQVSEDERVDEERIDEERVDDGGKRVDGERVEGNGVADWRLCYQGDVSRKVDGDLLRLTLVEGHYLQVIGKGDLGWEDANKYAKKIEPSQWAQMSHWRSEQGICRNVGRYCASSWEKKVEPMLDYDRGVAYLKVECYQIDDNLVGVCPENLGKLKRVWLMYQGKIRAFVQMEQFLDWLVGDGFDQWCSDRREGQGDELAGLGEQIRLVTFGGSRVDLHFLYQALLTEERWGLDKDRTCFFNQNFYRLVFGRFSCLDLALFLRNQEFSSVLDSCDRGFVAGLVEKDGASYLVELERVFREFNQLFYQQFERNLTQFYSTAGLAELMMKLRIPSGVEIKYTPAEVYDRVLEANFGARTFPLKHRFVSQVGLEIASGVDGSEGGVNGSEGGVDGSEGRVDGRAVGGDDLSLIAEGGYPEKMDQGEQWSDQEFERLVKSGDYLRFLDADSGYASVMNNCQFPVGDCQLVVGMNQKLLRGIDRLPLGLYKIRFKPAVGLRLPVLLKHDGNGQIRHDLLPGEGWYIHAEINTALEVGYQITVLEKIVWSGQSDQLFKDFVKLVYPKKLQSDQNLLMRQLYKDMLVSCFGKLFQKIGNYGQRVCKRIDEFKDFFQSYQLKGSIFNQDDSLTVYGKERRQDNQDRIDYLRNNIKKPYHLGVFILAYFRWYMVEMIRVFDPQLDGRGVELGSRRFGGKVGRGLSRVPFYYISTDAVVIRQSDYLLLKQKGWLFDREADWETSCLGKLKDNLVKDQTKAGYIVWAEFRGINQIRYKYLVEGEQKIRDSWKFSGVKLEEQSWEMFDGEAVEFEKKSCRVKDGKLIKKQIKGEIRLKLWDGMEYHSGEWFPFGYR